MGRIPTAKWPLWSDTQRQTIAVGETTNGSPLVFKAPRDVLVDEMSIQIFNAAGASIGGAVSIEYCNKTILDDYDLDDWYPCCQRKPFFLLGIRETKELELNVRAYVAVPALDTYTVEATLSGLQGKGCCY